MRSFCRRSSRGGFTLLEVFATLVVLLLALAGLAEFLTTVDRSWQNAASDPFGDAAAAFEKVTETLASATLEPYDDYADAGGAFRTGAGATFKPDHLARRSDLDFVCGPASGALAASGRTTTSCAVFFTGETGQTQLYAQSGMDRLLNAQGYFVEFGGDTDAPGFFSGAPRLRWRLKEVEEPSESLQAYATTDSATWIAQLTGKSAVPVILAENVIALIVLPERAASDGGAPIAPAYAYDSRNAADTLTFAQLPPRLRVALVAIDEPSAEKLAALHGTNAPALVGANLFQDSTKLDADLTSLDASLTAAKVHHRIFQRDLVINGSAWSNSSP